MVIIKELTDVNEIMKLRDIESRAWGTEDTVPHHIFIAGKFIGGVLLGAYINNKLIGYVFGLPAIYNNRLCHYSHQLAVIPEYRNLGIGAKLKLKQREKCIDMGLDLIIWTFDPLQGLNAYFNLRKLSVISKKYFVNHYGNMNDKINRGMPTDRLLAEWWIKSEWVINRLNSKGEFYNAVENPVINFVNDAFPKPNEMNLELYNEKVISIPIPLNINSIKLSKPELAFKWRIVTRKTFLNYLEKGYTIVDFIKKENIGFYILLKDFKLR